MMGKAATDWTRSADEDDNISLTSTISENYTSDQEFLVESIEFEKVVGGQKYYLIFWAGYPPEKATWEPKKHIQDHDILTTWNNKKKEIAAGVRPAFDLAKWELSVQEAAAAQKRRHRLRKIKRKRKGIPVSPNASDDESTEAKETDDEPEDDRGMRQKSKAKKSAPSPHKVKKAASANRPVAPKPRISAETSRESSRDTNVDDTSEARQKPLKIIEKRSSRQGSPALASEASQTRRNSASTAQQAPIFKWEDNPHMKNIPEFKLGSPNPRSLSIDLENTGGKTHTFKYPREVDWNSEDSIKKLRNWWKRMAQEKLTGADPKESDSSSDIPNNKRPAAPNVATTSSVSSRPIFPLKPAARVAPASASPIPSQGTSFTSVPVGRGQGAAKRGTSHVTGNVFTGGGTVRKAKPTLAQQAADPSKKQKGLSNMHLQNALLKQSRAKADAAPDLSAIGGLFDPSDPSKFQSLRPSNLRKSSSNIARPNPELQDDQRNDPMDISPVDASYSTDLSGAPWRNQDIPQAPPEPRGLACFFYRSPRGCNKGNQCTYLHSDDSTLPVASDPQAQARPSNYKTKACRIFLNEGSCFRGESCAFIHPSPTELGLEPALPGREEPEPSSFQPAATSDPSGRPSKFKTELCKWFQVGRCERSDEACAFIHARPTIAGSELALPVRYDPEPSTFQPARISSPETGPFTDNQPIDTQMTGVPAVVSSVRQSSHSRRPAAPRRVVTFADEEPQTLFMEPETNSPSVRDMSSSRDSGSVIHPKKSAISSTDKLYTSPMVTTARPVQPQLKRTKLSLDEYKKARVLQPSGVGAKEVFFGSDDPHFIMVDFGDISEGMQYPWGKTFFALRNFHFDNICTAQDFATQRVSILRQGLWRGIVNCDPKDETTLEVLEKVSQHLRLIFGGVVSTSPDFTILIYPPMPEWKFLEEDVNFSSETTLRYFIFRTELQIGRLAFTDLTIATNYRRSLIKSIHKLSFTKLLPKLVDKKMYHFYLLFPPSANETAAFVTSWIQDAWPGSCKIYSSQSEGSWDFFADNREIEYGIVLVHESVAATLSELPSLSKLTMLYQKGRHDTFWYIGDSSSLFPAFDPPLGSSPGQITATRLFPQLGHVLLLTPSLLVANPEEALKIIGWFGEKARNEMVAGSYRLACCHKILDYLLDLALEKSGERDAFQLKHLGNPRKDALEVEAGLNWVTCNSRFACHREMSALLAKQTGDGYSNLYNLDYLNESVSSIIYAPESVDPDNEQALATWFAGWSLTKLDQFYRFTIVGTGPSSKERAVRVKEIMVETPGEENLRPAQKMSFKPFSIAKEGSSAAKAPAKPSAGSAEKEKALAIAAKLNASALMNVSGIPRTPEKAKDPFVELRKPSPSGRKQTAPIPKGHPRTPSGHVVGTLSRHTVPVLGQSPNQLDSHTDDRRGSADFGLSTTSSRSGIVIDDNGQRKVPSSVRTDGSVRFEQQVRPGFIPAEDKKVYRNTRIIGGVPQWELENNHQQQPYFEAQNRNRVVTQADFKAGTVLKTLQTPPDKGSAGLQAQVGDVIQIMKKVSGALWYGRNLRTNELGQVPEWIFQPSADTSEYHKEESINRTEWPLRPGLKMKARLASHNFTSKSLNMSIGDDIEILKYLTGAMGNGVYHALNSRTGGAGTIPEWMLEHPQDEVANMVDLGIILKVLSVPRHQSTAFLDLRVGDEVEIIKWLWGNTDDALYLVVNKRTRKAGNVPKWVLKELDQRPDMLESKLSAPRKLLNASSANSPEEAGVSHSTANPGMVMQPGTILKALSVPIDKSTSILNLHVGDEIEIIKWLYGNAHNDIYRVRNTRTNETDKMPEWVLQQMQNKPDQAIALLSTQQPAPAEDQMMTDIDLQNAIMSSIEPDGDTSGEIHVTNKEIRFEATTEWYGRLKVDGKQWEHVYVDSYDKVMTKFNIKWEEKK